MARCVACGAEELAAVREPIEIGTPVFCGCGTMMVVDYIPIGPELEIPGVRLPLPAEATLLREDPDVKRWRTAYMLEQLDAAGNLKDKPMARTDGAGLLAELERARRRP